MGAEPTGCRWCGLPERGHGLQYLPAPGWHQWTQPTEEQIKERMLARRAHKPADDPTTTEE